jgi:hypothetical protein
MAPGGTSGGTGLFIIGLALLVAGGYLFLDNVVVRTSYRELFGFGHGTFGLSLIPLLIGVGWLFFDGKAIGGWLLTAAGVIIIIVGIIARMAVYWQSTSLFNTLLILVFIVGGVGLIARSLKAQ